ncbi:recombinase family protein [Streptomyces sp. NPDC058469]|uniref:recombinase family protein n=1 Tax=Streptomyces sp. NPDC058469 TaxID=3346514 RepID=UPI0036695C3D
MSTCGSARARARRRDRSPTGTATTSRPRRSTGRGCGGEAYKDTGSASKFATRIRDDFEKLLSDLETGAFGRPGDVLVLCEVSRLARETGRGVALVDAAEAGGYLIHVTSLERTFNPRNYGDRHSLISGISQTSRSTARGPRSLRFVDRHLIAGQLEEAQ